MPHPFLVVAAIILITLTINHRSDVALVARDQLRAKWSSHGKPFVGDTVDFWGSLGYFHLVVTDIKQGNSWVYSATSKAGLEHRVHRNEGHRKECL